MSMRSLIKALKGLWSLAVGLRITAVELVKPQITVHYPREEVKNLATYRGHIELVPLDADLQTPRCIMCWRCVDNCPSRCITLRMHVKGEEAGRAADPGLRLAPDIQVPYSQHRTPPPDVIERVLDVYRLNYSLCSLCGLCVQNCPADAIRFTGNAYLVGTTRQTFDIDLLARLRQRAVPKAAARGTARAA
jgi:NADH-quinone oxidoreductase subunit I